MATELGQKLQIGADERVLVLNGPHAYGSLVGHEADHEPDGEYDVVHLFVANQDELGRFATGALRALRPGGALWISYPKQSSGVPTDMTRDIGWDALHGVGWRPVSQVSVDDVWSALRFRPESEAGS
jgi:hypothetical protein